MSCMIISRPRYNQPGEISWNYTLNIIWNKTNLPIRDVNFSAESSNFMWKSQTKTELFVVKAKQSGLHDIGIKLHCNISFSCYITTYRKRWCRSIWRKLINTKQKMLNKHISQNIQLFLHSFHWLDVCFKTKSGYFITNKQPKLLVGRNISDTFHRNQFLKSRNTLEYNKLNFCRTKTKTST